MNPDMTPRGLSRVQSADRTLPATAADAHLDHEN